MALIEDDDAHPWITLRKAYFLLNITRFFSIAGLASVNMLLWFMMVNSFRTHTFFFFDLLSYFYLFILSSFLLVTELPQRILPASIRFYLLTHWPLVSYSSGLKTLSALQIAIGIVLLGYINNKDASSRDILGEAWWRIMCAIGAFMIFVGAANFCVTTLCVNVDDGGKILSARQIRDPETPDNPAAITRVTSFKCAQARGNDVECCRRTSPQTPAKAYTPKGQRV